MSQDILDLVDDESAFALRDPEEAPLWLQLVCAGLIVGIAVVTFVAIGRVS
jgi:hypothetical protein